MYKLIEVCIYCKPISVIQTFFDLRVDMPTIQAIDVSSGF